MKILIFLILFIPCFAWEEYRDFDMPMAASAYSDNPSECFSNIQKAHYGTNNNLTITIYRQYSARCESLNDTCFGYIANDNGVTFYIVFRGTNNNYKFFEEDGWNYHEMVPFVGGGKVSKIIFEGFNDMWNSGMKDDLLMLKNKYPEGLFNFYGHSLGGAIASLAAATFWTISPNQMIFLNTFGQPRIGDKDFSNAFNEMNFFALRNVYKADIVPHLPPLNESVYYHHSSEIWYVNATFILGCDRDAEDSRCSDSLPYSDYNMKDHKYYYGRNFIEFGKSGCQDLGKIKNNQS